jgi:hypothetical protein
MILFSKVLGKGLGVVQLLDQLKGAAALNGQ